MKKVVALFLVLVLCLSLATVASAAPGKGKGNNNGNGKACGVNNNQGAYKKAVQIVDAANAKIESLIRVAQITPYDDTAELIIATSAIAYSAKIQVAQLGYVAQCTYTTYYVDGKYIPIDPLWVINPLPQKKGKGDDDSGKKD